MTGRPGAMNTPSLAGLMLGLTLSAFQTQAQTLPSLKDPVLPPPTVQLPVQLPGQIPPTTEPAALVPMPESLAPSAQRPVSGSPRHFIVTLKLTDRTAGFAPASPDRLFRVTVPADAKETAATCPPRSGYLDRQWLWTCLSGSETAAGPDDRMGAFASSDAQVAWAIDRINTVFYENGYVNSGIRLTSPAGAPGSTVTTLAIELVVGTLSDCRDRALSSRSGVQRYAVARLIEGCRSDRPFNVYSLERNFRLLASDETVARVNVDLQPVDIGVASLAGKKETDVKDGKGDLVQPSSSVQLWTTLSNDRAPSIGSLRHAAGAQWRPWTGFAVRGEIGETDGATDIYAAVGTRLGSAWHLDVSADHSDAAIVEPVLRSLDIRSKSSGAEATLTFTPIRCPLMPRFGPPTEDAPSPFENPLGACNLSARVLGDVPVGWSAARSLSLDVSIAGRTTDTSLLGLPFSFSPGSVDGHTEVVVARGALNWLDAGRFGRRGERGWTAAARMTISKGLSGTQSTLPGADGPSPHFTSVNFQWNAAVELPWGGLVVDTHGTTQLADGQLYTSERLPVGGATSVRGYAFGTLLADEAGYASLEVNRTLSLSHGRRIVALNDFDPGRFSFGAFIDSGFARTLGAAGTHDSLSSAGLRAAWVPSKAASVELSWSNRFDKTVQTGRDNLLDNGLSLRLEFRPLELCPEQRSLVHLCKSN